MPSHFVVLSIPILVVVFLVAVAQLRQPRHLLWHKPESPKVIKTQLRFDEVLTALETEASLLGYRVVARSSPPGTLVLADWPSLTSFGFFYPIYVSAGGGVTMVEIGIKSRLMQDNPGNVVRAQKHEECFELVRRTIGGARAAARSAMLVEVHRAGAGAMLNRRILKSTAMWLLVGSVAQWSRFVGVTGALPDAVDWIAVVLNVAAGTALLALGVGLRTRIVSGTCILLFLVGLVDLVGFLTAASEPGHPVRLCIALAYTAAAGAAWKFALWKFALRGWRRGCPSRAASDGTRL
jgi:hypothetical protein